MLRIGIIGYGYWGPNLLRNFSSMPGCRVAAVADKRKSRLDVYLGNRHDIILTTDPDDILTSDEIDAVVIATPVSTHFDLGKKALKNGKHVLMEKPLTSSPTLAKKLIDLAESKNLLLMVDHTFVYNGAVKKIKELVASGDIGQLKYVDSTRINLGIFQSDTNVIWDLAPHDVSILLYLTDEMPVSVNATGISHTGNGVENIAYMTLNYGSGFIAHLHCSWSSPLKVRMMLIGGDRKMIVYDEMALERVKVHETRYEFNNDEDKRNIIVDCRTGDILTPKLSTKEALRTMAEDFVGSIKNSTIPLSDSLMALRVVNILSAAEKSIRNNGKEIKLDL